MGRHGKANGSEGLGVATQKHAIRAEIERAWITVEDERGALTVSHYKASFLTCVPQLSHCQPTPRAAYGLAGLARSAC